MRHAVGESNTGSRPRTCLHELLPRESSWRRCLGDGDDDRDRLRARKRLRRLIGDDGVAAAPLAARVTGASAADGLRRRGAGPSADTASHRAAVTPPRERRWRSRRLQKTGKKSERRSMSGAINVADRHDDGANFAGMTGAGAGTMTQHRRSSASTARGEKTCRIVTVSSRFHCQLARY